MVHLQFKTYKQEGDESDFVLIGERKFTAVPSIGQLFTFGNTEYKVHQTSPIEMPGVKDAYEVILIKK